MTTVAKVKENLKGWQLSRYVFVGDAGMVSKANLETLSKGGGKYILCMPIHRGGEVASAVVTRPGRYQKVADNLEVKEVTVGDGERRRRYVAATTLEKPSGNGITGNRCSMSSVPRSNHSPSRPVACMPSASARCAPQAATAVTCDSPRPASRASTPRT